MADQEAHSLASTFPNPPLFWRDFTADRVARVEELRGAFAGAGTDASAAVVRIPGLPDELTNLQPPLEPADGRWRVFGDQYMLDDKLPTLQDQGIVSLRPPAPSGTTPPPRDAKHLDRAFELKKLTKSLLLNFLELTGLLSGNPPGAESKIGHLRTLFINVHHVLNEYRPHQARESAIALMQSHLDRTRSETVAIRTQVDKARRVLEGLGSLRVGNGDLDSRLGTEGALDGGGVEGERGLGMERRLWVCVDEEFV